MENVRLKQSPSWRKWVLGFSDCFDYKDVSQSGLHNSHFINLGVFINDNMFISAYMQLEVVTLRCY